MKHPQTSQVAWHRNETRSMSVVVGRTIMQARCSRQVCRCLQAVQTNLPRLCLIKITLPLAIMLVYLTDVVRDYSHS